MVPIHQVGGAKVTNVVSLVRSSIGWPDTAHFHRSDFGLINGLIPPSEIEIWVFIIGSKSIHTI